MLMVTALLIAAVIYLLIGVSLAVFSGAGFGFAIAHPAMLVEFSTGFFTVLVSFWVGCYFGERRARRRAERLEQQRRMFAVDPNEYVDFDLE